MAAAEAPPPEDIEPLLAEIASDYRLTAHLTGRAVPSPVVVAALRAVPRHAFVPAAERRFAYENRPLPIGGGQTISQPFIVALMTDLLDPGPDHVVLEIGTGCGYQAAVLARIVRRVYSVEVVPELAAGAARRLAMLGYDSVAVRDGDGYGGWPEHAPYDGIIVTAGAADIPEPLLAQLKPGGRMVIPVDHGVYGQVLLLVEKDANGHVRRRDVLPVAFVPFTRR
ncbi:MAG: protein-L-isoaspartate(D-aspartate) O-methyltransferase [Alphaproteobacteria bacterium]